MPVIMKSEDGNYPVCIPRVRLSEAQAPMVCEVCGQEIKNANSPCPAVPPSQRWKVVEEGEFYSHLQEAAKSFNGREWAIQFVYAMKQNSLEVDEDLMEIWFANAIMAGYDAGKLAAKAES